MRINHSTNITCRASTITHGPWPSACLLAFTFLTRLPQPCAVPVPLRCKFPCRSCVGLPTVHRWLLLQSILTDICCRIAASATQRRQTLQPTVSFQLGLHTLRFARCTLFCTSHTIMDLPRYHIDSMLHFCCYLADISSVFHACVANIG